MHYSMALAGIDMQDGSPTTAHLLATNRVYLLRMLPCVAVSSYLTPFTLTPLRGGIVSVALSLGSPPAAVSGCRILYCPDFPLHL